MSFQFLLTGTRPMSDVLLNILFIIFTIFLAIIGAFIGAWLQHRNWIRQNKENDRQERMQAAFSIAHQVATLIGKRTHRQRRIIWAIQSGNDDEIENERIEYKKSVDEWMQNLGRIKSELWTYYGKTESFSFEQDVHDLLASNGRKIEYCISNKKAIKIHEIEKDLDFITYKCFLFSQELLHRAQEQNIRGLQNRHLLIYSNWSNLSYSYLLNRLFGIHDN